VENGPAQTISIGVLHERPTSRKSLSFNFDVFWHRRSLLDEYRSRVNVCPHLLSSRLPYWRLHLHLRFGSGRFTAEYFLTPPFSRRSAAEPHPAFARSLAALTAGRA
jgi:hypothetical protein